MYIDILVSTKENLHIGEKIIMQPFVKWAGGKDNI